MMLHSNKFALKSFLSHWEQQLLPNLIICRDQVLPSTDITASKPWSPLDFLWFSIKGKKKDGFESKRLILTLNPASATVTKRQSFLLFTPTCCSLQCPRAKTQTLVESYSLFRFFWWGWGGDLSIFKSNLVITESFPTGQVHICR